MAFFHSFESTVTPFTPRNWPVNLRMLVHPVTGAPAGIQNMNANGPDGLWTPVDLTAEQIAAPTPEMIADLNSVFRLNVAPYTRYRSDGTGLVTDTQIPASALAVIGDGAGAVSHTLFDKLNAVVTVGDYPTAQIGAIAALNRIYHVPALATVALTVPTDAASIDAALIAVAQWTIPNSSTVTINLPTGAIARTTPVVINHPYGARIAIAGAAPVVTTASAAGSVTGSSGAWAVPLTVVSAAGMAVNDYVLIRNVTGTSRFNLFGGICKITAIVGALVTVTNTAKNAAWPTATLTAADVICLKTRLVFTGCDGIQIDGPLGYLNNVALVGDHTVGSIGLITNRMSIGYKGKGYVSCGTSVGISGFGDGGIYAQYGGTVDAPYICVADCTVYNVLAQHGGAVNVNNAISSGSAQAGFASSSAGAVSAESSIACGNGTYGYFAFQGSALLVQNCFAHANVSDGLRVAWGGSIRGSTINTQYNGGNGVYCVGGDIVCSINVTASNNTGAGLYAEGGGSIYAANGVFSNNGSYGAYCDGATIDCPTSVAASNAISGLTVINNGTILADAVSGAGNGMYIGSATRGGFIRATNASASGLAFLADTEGVIDVTGVTGSPTLTCGQDGVILNATNLRGSVLYNSTANIAIGATNAAGFNMDRSSSSFVRFARAGALVGMVGADDGATLVAGAAGGDMVLRADSGSLWLSIGGSATGRLTSTGLNATPIGVSTQAAASFTTLAASGAVSGAGFTAYLASPAAIGGTTAAAGTFTSLLTTTGNIAIGATNSAGFNMDKASSSFVRFARSGTLAGMIGADDGGSLVTGAAAGDMVLRASSALWLSIGGSATGKLTSTGLNATPIGVTTPAAGAFTTLSASGATLIGGGTLSGLPYDFQTAINFDPSTGVAVNRRTHFQTTLNYASTTTNIWEGLTQFTHVNGPGTATGEINSIHSYMQFNAGSTVNAYENFEASVINNGAVNDGESFLSLINNAATGTYTLLRGIKFVLANANTTAGAIASYAAINMEAMTGVGSFPTNYHLIRNAEPKATISTLGGLNLGALATLGTGLLFNLVGTDNAGGTFSITTKNLAGTLMFGVANDAKVYFGNAASSVDVNGAFSAVVYKIGSTQVVGARQTGWTAMTGGPNIASVYDTATVTLPQLAARVQAIQAGLTTHGLIGT